MLGVREEEHVARLYNWAHAAYDQGTHYRNRTFEEGILAAIEWLEGNSVLGPHEEDKEEE
jgi:hypothetical protein